MLRSMILGLGVDACECGRIRKVMERQGDRFLSRILTPAEWAYCRTSGHPWENVAARFAAKEACSKALGVPDGIRWHDVEVRHADRMPVLLLDGVAAAAAERLGVRATHLALSHERTMAVAVVVLEG
jgi:holo-[acyl-carrier protein] synthase